MKSAKSSSSSSSYSTESVEVCSLYIGQLLQYHHLLADDCVCKKCGQGIGYHKQQPPISTTSSPASSSVAFIIKPDGCIFDIDELLDLHECWLIGLVCIHCRRHVSDHTQQPSSSSVSLTSASPSSCMRNKPVRVPVLSNGHSKPVCSNTVTAVDDEKETIGIGVSIVNCYTSAESNNRSDSRTNNNLSNVDEACV